MVAADSKSEIDIYMPMKNEWWEPVGHCTHKEDNNYFERISHLQWFDITIAAECYRFSRMHPHTHKRWSWNHFRNRRKDGEFTDTYTHSLTRDVNWKKRYWMHVVVCSVHTLTPNGRNGRLYKPKWNNRLPSNLENGGVNECFVCAAYSESTCVENRDGPHQCCSCAYFSSCVHNDNR